MGEFRVAGIVCLVSVETLGGQFPDGLVRQVTYDMFTRLVYLLG